MALCTILLFSISWSAALQEGFSLPVIGQSDMSDPKPVHRVRTKRCSCTNQLDSECHYFCHLDIIWVNTPSKTTVYGLGSPIARRRRSIDRCLCANPADRRCNNFCVQSSGNADAVLNIQPEPLHGKSERFTVDLKSTLESLDSADSQGIILQGTVNDPRADLLKLLRDLVRAKSRAMKKAASLRRSGSRPLKPGYS